jgi:hypothetical protein
MFYGHLSGTVDAVPLDLPEVLPDLLPDLHVADLGLASSMRRTVLECQINQKHNNLTMI